MYTSPPSVSYCGDECTCTFGRLNELQDAVQREVFRKVLYKLYRMNSKMHDFNSLCDNFMSILFENILHGLGLS